MAIEQRIGELGLELPPVPAPGADYANAVRTGNEIFGARHAHSAI